MAGVRIAGTTAQIATGTAAKTIMQIVAASNHRVLVKELSISFEGTSNTAAPIQVRTLIQTDAGTMSALTLVKIVADDDETIQTSAQHSATGEPTPSDVYDIQLVHPQTGFGWQAPYGEPLVITGGARLGLEVTAAADVDCVAAFKGEE